MSIDLLPDCRAKTTRGRIFTAAGTWVPIFCANCGAPGGSCPEENMTFLFYQCVKCAEKYGQVAGTMMMPDEVFFGKLKDAMVEEHGRVLNELELVKVVEDGASPLAKLILDAPSTGV